MDVCEQVVRKVQLGQEVQAREALWIKAVANRIKPAVQQHQV